ncbi:MAG: hypothetical protein COV52_03600 [Gammaproteobacteria bacterium CG11_big_fil_rev_8_21_14_0_20_46_22]|nr:MAG: hypothetical protein COW05_05260 [Gammaproteobacteria bacterium CG12_big_fil_rev_8_21_14_0_65_46_12]PIR11491.1 MAG: hypothetical protein COV52_03600 [Gammaproteobacteria bacterium CG11_big_fil_rev_8_21_14_0_20_46_22]
MSALDLNHSPEVTISVLDKTYRFRCAPEDQDSLHKAAKLLEQQLRKTRETGVLGADRLLLVTALNLAGDFIAARDDLTSYDKKARESLEKVIHKIDEALTTAEQLELE